MQFRVRARVSAGAPTRPGSLAALVAHLREHAVRTDGAPYTLKSGRQADWFVDAKATTCSPEGMLLVADAALEVIPGDVTAIGGLTVGADAMAYAIAALAATRGRLLTSFTVRKEAKPGGTGGRIAGVLAPGAKVVITEDAVTRGVSMLEAARVVREEGRADPVLLLPLVDRGGTVGALAEAAGIPLHVLVPAPALGFDYGPH